MAQVLENRAWKLKAVMQLRDEATHRKPPPPERRDRSRRKETPSGSRGSGAPPETGTVESHLAQLWEGRAAAAHVLSPFCLDILPVKVTSAAI